MKSVNPLGLVFQFYVNIFTVAIFFKFFLILYELIGPPIFWDLWSIWLSRHGHAFTLSIFQFTEKDWQLNLGHQTAYGRCCIIMVCRRNKLFPPSPSLSLSLSLSNPGWWYARRDPAEAKLIVFRHFQEWKPNTQHPTLTVWLRVVRPEGGTPDRVRLLPLKIRQTAPARVLLLLILTKETDDGLGRVW